MADGFVGTMLDKVLIPVGDWFARFSKRYEQIPKDIDAFKTHLPKINEIINKRSEIADQNGIRSCEDDNCRRLKLRMEDAVKYYELMVSDVGWEGFLAQALHRLKDRVQDGPETKLIGYIDEIKELKAVVDAYDLPADASGNGENYPGHDPVSKPVGLETPTEELVEMLSNATLLRVVAFFCPDGSQNSDHAKAAYDQVKDEEDFEFNAWVEASEVGEVKLLQNMLDQLGASYQESQDLLELRRILNKFLTKKRYIIGIDGLQATCYWNNVKDAFPDDKMNSRIIVTMKNQEIAEACSKNCTFHDSSEQTHAKLIRRLSRGKDVVSVRMVVAVSGRGGCGKSVLAELAYKEVKEEYDYKAFSRKTQNGKDLLKDIIVQLMEPKQLESKTQFELWLKEKGQLELVGILNDFLKGKRYIIGIDGLETIIFWNNVKEACPDESTSSRIIVTTTDSKVANICHQNCSVFMMQVLDKSAAMKLLVRKVFDQDRCPDNVSTEDLTVFLEISEYLPLAIANIGDHLKGQGKKWMNYKECEEEWLAVGSQLVDKSNKTFGGMRHVLDRSYTNLSVQAKACLRSLSLYPNNLDIENYVINDHIIKVKPLIRRLLVEKLISPSDNLAKDCFDPLIVHNFIIPTEFSIRGHVKSFRVNRMLLQFNREKADHQNYVTRIDIKEPNDVTQQIDVIRLHLHNKNESSREHTGIGGVVELSRVRLLMFHGRASKALMNFDDYTFLQVLILENCEDMTDEYLNPVCCLKMLNYLSIRGNKCVSKLPEDIANMKSLETLDTRDTEVQMLSMNVIILLNKLTHLFGKFKITCTEEDLKSFIAKSKTCQLQTLAGFIINESPNFVKLLPFMSKLSKVNILWRSPKNIKKNLMRMNALNNVGSQEMIALDSEWKIDLVESLNTCFKWKLCESRLHSLSLDFDGYILDFLNDVAVPSFLYSLKLCGKLITLPEWITLKSPEEGTSQSAEEPPISLSELCLSASNVIGLLPKHKCLGKLEFLKLTEESTKFEEEYTWHNGWFKNLKRLCLDFKLQKLPKIVIEEGAMRNLQFLQLSCTDLGGFDGIQNLICLEELILPSAVMEFKGAVDLLNDVKMLLPERPRVHMV